MKVFDIKPTFFLHKYAQKDSIWPEKVGFVEFSGRISSNLYIEVEYDVEFVIRKFEWIWLNSSKLIWDLKIRYYLCFNLSPPPRLDIGLNVNINKILNVKCEASRPVVSNLFWFTASFRTVFFNLFGSRHPLESTKNGRHPWLAKNGNLRHF